MIVDAGLDVLYSFVSQEKPLANCYYTRHPENCTEDKNKVMKNGKRKYCSVGWCRK